MSSPDVIAILCSDIHLSSRAPIARSVEPDWFAAMRRQLRELRELQQEYECPVICAGDIFDRWYSTPELINFALAELPDKMYAVPGQHDLPDHSMDEIHRSAYWTLVKAGKVTHLSGRMDLDNLILYGYGWQQKIRPPSKEAIRNKRIKLAVIHQYCWNSRKTCFPGAPKEGHILNISKACLGVDSIVTGDNHKSFYINMPEEEGDPHFINPGSFFRRKTDEVSHRPLVGLLSKHGSISVHYLNCDKDQFIDIDKGLEVLEKGLDLTELVDDLKSLGNGTLDFVESLYQYMDKNGIAKSVRKIITQSLEDRSHGRRPK